MTIVKQTRDEKRRYHSYNDEPAIELSNGDKSWYKHGKLHRENGPAVELSNGDKYWYIHDKECTFYEWLKLVSLSEDHKVELLLSHD